MNFKKSFREVKDSLIKMAVLAKDILFEIVRALSYLIIGLFQLLFVGIKYSGSKLYTVYYNSTNKTQRQKVAVISGSLIVLLLIMLAWTLAPTAKSDNSEFIFIDGSGMYHKLVYRTVCGTPSRSVVKKVRPDVGFEQIIQPFQYEKLEMIGETGRFGVAGSVEDIQQGTVLRALRFRNITYAVEKKYDLPQDLIFAMVCKESNGVDLLPNGLNDGGFGLCHMQGLLAHEFSLFTYDGCKKLVCKNHGKQLADVFRKNNYNRDALYQYDNRIHPILNLDAVGRMIRYYMDGPAVPGYEPGLETAMRRYSGRSSRDYWNSVKPWMELVKDAEFMSTLETRFNNLNNNLLINGQSGDFQKYIESHQLYNLNYGLEEYINWCPGVVTDAQYVDVGK